MNWNEGAGGSARVRSEMMEATKDHNIPIVLVVPECFDIALKEDGVDVVTWDFYVHNHTSD